MNKIEIIGILIASIGTILGGVWFIIAKVFHLGESSNKLTEVDRRTCNAQCDLHDNDISTLKNDLRDIKNDLVAIKSLLVMKHKDASTIFSMKKSPRQLNENGIKLYSAVKGDEFLQTNKSFLYSKMDDFKPKTALDVENAANIICSANTDNDIFNEIKSFVYNSPSFILIGEDGKECTYDIGLSDVCFVLSIPLRDMYLESHPEISQE